MDRYAKPLARRRFLAITLSTTALATFSRQAGAVVTVYYGRGYTGGYS